MRFITAAAIAACAATANAFVDTHPFIYFSTEAEQNLDALKNTDLTTFSDLKSTLTTSCPSASHLLLVTLPGLNAADFEQPTNFGKSILETVKSNNYPTFITVPEVAGEIDVRDLVSYYKNTCRMKAKEVRYTNQRAGKQEPYVEDAFDMSTGGFGNDERGFGRKGDKTVTSKSLYSMSSLATQRGDEKSLRDRKKRLQYDESLFLDLVKMYEDADLESYAVIFMGDAGMVPIRESSEQELVKQFKREEASNGTYDSRPLFEKYQFFTPGLFMGLSVTLLLLVILSVGIKAISSLQVSYGAFEKESGPQSAKKAQ